MAGNDVTATFAGDIGPLEKAAAQLRAAMKATQANVSKDLTFTPKIDDTAMKASLANIQVQLKQWQQGAFSKMVVPPPRDFAASNAYLDGVYSKVPDPTTSALRRGGMPATGGGGGRMNAGLVGQQVQDIAVQLQGGTSALTVFAQQGSQLASIFGPGGMIVGGIAAVAGATLAVGKASKDSFDKMIAGAAASHAEVTKLLNSAGLREIESTLGKINQQADQLAKERLRTDGLGVQIGRLVGGASPDERRSAIQDEQLKTVDDLLALQKRALDVSKEEVQIATLRSQGRNKEADDLERQTKLRQRLAEIEDSSLGRSAKDQLKADAIAISSAEKQSKISAEKAKEENAKLEERTRLTQSILGLQQALGEDRMTGAGTPSDKLTALEAMQKKRRNEAAMNGLSLSQGDIDARIKSGDLSGAEKSLKALKEYQATQQQIIDLNAEMKQSGAEEAKANWQKQERVRLVKEEWEIEQQISNAIARSGRRETPEVKALEDKAKTQRLKEQFVGQGMNAQEAQAKAETTVKNDNAAQEAVKRREQSRSLEEMQVSAAINNARAHGHIGQADRMESKAAEDRKTKDLVELGMPEAEARKQARGMQRDEDKLAGRRGSIKGGRSSNEWGLDKPRTPALDAWKAQANVPIKAQTPALDAMMKRQAASNAKAAGKANSGASNAETLLEAAVKILTSMDNKLKIAR